MDFVTITNHLRLKSRVSFVCDAPARALLKGIIVHTGYHYCERCVVVGTCTCCQNRTVFNLPVVE